MEKERASHPARGGGRRAIVRMFVFGTIASVLGVIGALLIDWFPVEGSTQAEHIDTLWDVLLIFSVPIAVLVFTVVIFSVIEFRMRPGEENLDGPPVHGSTRLEAIWTAIPAIIVVGLVAYAWVVLVDIEKAPASAERRVVVTGEQFAWTFTYDEPGRRPFTSTRLHLPNNESVRFVVRSKDVLHDFWMPAMRMKIDAVPGIDTSYRITPKREGTYDIVCAELCGLGHAFMRQEAVVESPAAFARWVQAQSGGSGTPSAGGSGGSGTINAAAARTLFTESCGSCHVLADADTSGRTGPSLDTALRDRTAAFIRESIVEPGAEVARGYPNIMPATFGQTLSRQELDGLVRYLQQATE